MEQRVRVVEAVLAVQTRGDRQAQTWLDAWQQQQQQQQNLQCTDSSNSTPTLQQQWQTCISLVTELVHLEQENGQAAGSDAGGAAVRFFALQTLQLKLRQQLLLNSTASSIIPLEALTALRTVLMNQLLLPTNNKRFGFLTTKLLTTLIALALVFQCHSGTSNLGFDDNNNMEWDFISDIVNTLLHSHSSTTTTTTITNSSFSSSLFLEFLTLVPQEIQQIIQSASVVAGSTTSIPSLSTSSSPSSSILLSPMKQRVLESLVLSHIDSTVLPLLSGIILNSEEGGGGGGESGHEMKQKAFVCAASYVSFGLSTTHLSTLFRLALHGIQTPPTQSQSNDTITATITAAADLMIELLEQRNLGALEASVCAALCPVFVGSGGGGQDIGWFGKSFIEAIQKGDEIVATPMLKLLLAFTDYAHSHLVATLLDPQTAAIHSLLLTATDFPGLFGHDEECSDLTLPYWCTLAETLEETGFNFSSVHHSNSFSITTTTPVTAISGGGVGDMESSSTTASSLNSAVRLLFLGVLERIVRKMAYPSPTSSNIGNGGWSKDARDKLGIYRRDAAETVQACYTLIREGALQALVGLSVDTCRLLAAGGNGDVTTLESALFAIKILSECVPAKESRFMPIIFSPDVLGFISLLNSNLQQQQQHQQSISTPASSSFPFSSAQSPLSSSSVSSISISLRLVKTMILVIGAYAPFLKLNPHFLPPALELLVSGTSNPATAMVAAYSLRDVCDVCRRQLIPHVDTLISVWSALNSSNNNNSDLSVSASDKEKVVEAVSSVIAALSSTEKPARLITILSGILSDTRSALMHVANIRREQQQQRDTSIAESSAGLDRIRVADHLRYLKACCRGVGSTVSDPDGEEEDDFEVILDNVDKGGEKRQGSATNAHPPPPPTLLQLNPELKRRESEATQLVWSVVQDTIALFGNDEEIMTLLCAFVNFTLQSSDLFFAPDAPSLVSLLCQAFAAFPHACFLKTSMSTVFYCADIKNRSTNIGGGGEHSENKKAQTDREMTRLFGELSVTVVRLLGNEDAMEKSPDIVAAYFELLEMFIEKCPDSIALLPSDLLEAIFLNLVVTSMRLQERFALRSALRFLSNFIGTELKNNALQSLVHAVVEKVGRVLLIELLTSVGGRCPKTLVGFVAEALHKLCVKYPDACRSWMTEEMTARQSWPSSFVSVEDKRNFINVAVGTVNRKKFKDAIEAFSSKCRGYLK